MYCIGTCSWMEALAMLPTQWNLECIVSEISFGWTHAHFNGTLNVLFPEFSFWMEAWPSQWNLKFIVFQFSFGWEHGHNNGTSNVGTWNLLCVGNCFLHGAGFRLIQKDFRLRVGPIPIDWKTRSHCDGHVAITMEPQIGTCDWM